MKPYKRNETIMFNVHKVEKEIGGKLLSLETGRIARQAHGAVIAQMGDTMVLAAAVTAPPASGKRWRSAHL